MKKTLSMLLAGSALVVLSGCGATYPAGSLYTSTTTPHGIDRAELTGAGKSGDKKGEACATGILNVVAFGDASIDAAKKAASITEVHAVDFQGTNILGIYQQGCTVITGKLSRNQMG